MSLSQSFQRRAAARSIELAGPIKTLITDKARKRRDARREIEARRELRESAFDVLFPAKLFPAK